MAKRQRLPGLNYVLDDYSNDKPFPLVGFNLKVFSIPETTKLGNCRSLNEFEKICTIAEGTFGTVYKVKDVVSNEIYAMKKLKIIDDEFKQPRDVMPQKYLRQISNMRKVKHINVLELKDVVVGTNLDGNYLLMDYCRYNLEDAIGQVSPVFFQHQHIKNIMLQMLEGLQYIHTFNIIHRDLCLKNILFTEEGILKIADFGASRTASDIDMTPAHGQRWYRAPEILFGSLKYTKAVDIWAVGCMFGEMILQKPVFDAESDGDIVRAMIDLLGSPSERHWPGYSKLPVPRIYRLRKQPYSRVRFVFHNQTIATVNYLQKFLKYNPASRPCVEELLNDPYYAEYPRRCVTDALVFMLKISERI